MAFALSTAYEQAGEHRKALKVLLDLWGRTSPGRNQLHIADLLIRVSRTVGEPERVPAILDQLTTQFGDDPNLAVVVAAERKRGGDEQGAIALLRDALSRSTGNARDRVAIQLAEHLVHKGVSGEAADLYASMVAGARTGPLARQLLLTLYNAGRYREAWDLAARLRESGDDAAIVAKLQARLLEFTAKTTYLALAEAAPADPEPAVQAAQLAYRMGDRDEARRIVEMITELQIRNAPEVLIRVAQLRASMAWKAHFPWRIARGGLPLIRPASTACITRSSIDSRWTTACRPRPPQWKWIQP